MILGFVNNIKGNQMDSVLARIVKTFHSKRLKIKIEIIMERNANLTYHYVTSLDLPVRHNS